MITTTDPTALYIAHDEYHYQRADNYPKHFKISMSQEKQVRGLYRLVIKNNWAIKSYKRNLQEIDIILDSKYTELVILLGSNI